MTFHPVKISLLSPLLKPSESQDELNSLCLKVPSNSHPSFDKAKSNNIQRMFIFSGFMGFMAAITGGGIFDNYLFALTNNNATVGWAESIGGITQLIFAIPVGLICDKLGESNQRSYLVILSAIIGMFGCALNIFGFITDCVDILYFSLVLNGLSVCLSNPSVNALFADSIPQGHRAEYMSKYTMIMTFSTGIGPFLGMTMFYFLGNEWDISIMHKILIVSNIGLFLGQVVCFGWLDVPPANDSASDSLNKKITTLDVSKYSWMVPYILFFNDMVMATGAGMTVKFFPLFFARDYGLSPIQVQMVTACVPLIMSPTIYACKLVAGVIGRMQAVVLFNVLGICCLLVLAHVESTALVILAYMVRGAVQNAIYPIDQSVLMDFVLSNRRGMWSSLSSLTRFTWTGSAFIGGYLSDSHDYRYTFMITANVYIGAMIFRAPLLYLVPREEKFVKICEEDRSKNPSLETFESKIFDSVVPFVPKFKPKLKISIKKSEILHPSSNEHQSLLIGNAPFSPHSFPNVRAENLGFFRSSTNKSFNEKMISFESVMEEDLQEENKKNIDQNNNYDERIVLNRSSSFFISNRKYKKLNEISVNTMSTTCCSSVKNSNIIQER